MSVATSRPRARRRQVSLALRARMEAAVEHLLALMDELDGDPDLEPSLGYSDGGKNDDREGDPLDERGEYDTADDEPSLGSTADMNQIDGWKDKTDPAHWLNPHEEQDVRIPRPPRHRTEAENIKTRFFLAGGCEVVGPDGRRYKGVTHTAVTLR